ncbi:MAG TPA: hypothetical protein VK420_12585, partial [Longimicrobium sp.]|nr:hypothetical protein [Longimicrobium sp.]
MTTLTTKTDRFSVAHAATRPFPATRAEQAPQAARLSLKAPPLTAATGFETGRSGGAAEARALRFPWPGHGSADKIGWIRDVKPGTTDATGEFNRLNELAQEGKDVLPKDANKYVYLAVGGLFSGAAPKEIYFDQNLDALKDAGLKAVLSAGVKALGGDPACGIDLTYKARQ